VASFYFITIVLVPGGRFSLSHSYQIYFGFPGPDFNFDYGLCDHVIMRFASSYVGEEGWVALSQDNDEVEVGERERGERNVGHMLIGFLFVPGICFLKAAQGFVIKMFL